MHAETHHKILLCKRTRPWSPRYIFLSLTHSRSHHMKMVNHIKPSFAQLRVQDTAQRLQKHYPLTPHPPFHDPLFHPTPSLSSYIVPIFPSPILLSMQACILCCPYLVECLEQECFCILKMAHVHVAQGCAVHEKHRPAVLLTQLLEDVETFLDLGPSLWRGGAPRILRISTFPIGIMRDRKCASIWTRIRNLESNIGFSFDPRPTRYRQENSG